ncbi:MAG: DNA repair protein RecN [Bacteroidales bacterium]|nr:DNA repair protein RecN [Bacteroidales bacterium]
MLQHLKVENYALIRQLEIAVGDGFAVITGETGAGKSIIIGALSLILGQRADTQVLLDTTKKCVIEGTFLVSGYSLEEFFGKNDLDYGEQAIIRREILPNGKSRAFINDTPVSLQLLKELGMSLVDIHSQNAVITLNNYAAQRDILDDYAGNNAMVNKYQAEFKQLGLLITHLQHLREEDNKARRDQDYYQFLFEELNNAAFIVGEQEELEEELRIQTHAEEIKTVLYSTMQLLAYEDSSIQSRLTEAQVALRRAAEFHPAFNEICQRLDTIYIELGDISRELARIDDTVVYTPLRIEHINERLSIIYHLQQKHRTNSVKDLLAMKSEFAIRLDNIVSLSDRIAHTEKQLKHQEEIVSALANELSAKRKNAASPFALELLTLIKQLGMPEANIRIEISNTAELNKDGFDKVTFLFNANRGGELKELSNVASGGELSRVMLSVKHLLSGRKKLPTMVFDEIDSGLSGEIAGKMGNMMQQMAQSMQVITITHLPQIAAKAKSHFLVFKENTEHDMRSNIRLLDPEERVFEIAKMLSDEQVTETGLKAAQELISR